MMHIVSLPFYQQIDPLAPSLVQKRAIYYHRAFAGRYYTPAFVPLPWSLESLVGSRWAHISTGEQVCIRDLGYQSDKCYPIFDTHYPVTPLSSIGEWGDSFIILQWVRIDTASVEATLPWYQFLQDFLSHCLDILSREPKSATTVLQKMTLEHQYSQAQRVVDAITEFGRIKSTL